MNFIIENAQPLVNVGGSAKRGPVYRVLLIKEGQGSSGYYGREMLEEFLPVALPKGSKVYMEHMPKELAAKGEPRPPEDLMGVLLTDPYWSESDNGMVADVRFYRKFAEFIEDAIDEVGVSIEIHDGAKDDQGTVLEMYYHRFNSLAVVTEPGAGGEIRELLKEHLTLGKDSDTETKETSMNKDEMLALLQESNKPLVEGITLLAEGIKSLTALREEDNKIDETAKDTEALVEAVVAANLTEHGRKAVYSAVANGSAVVDAIEAEKGREAAIRESLKFSHEDDNIDRRVRLNENLSYDEKFDKLFAKGGN